MSINSAELAPARASRLYDGAFGGCPKCGLFYVRGSPQDEKEHRRKHRQWAAVAEPTPDKKITALGASDGLIKVNWRSPRWLNKVVYERARLFRREFGYDFIQWSWDPAAERLYRSPDEEDAQAFLFIESNTAVGACAFRWRNYEASEGASRPPPPPGWAMQWVWLAPAFRRKGILSRHWLHFERIFGQFYLERPLSSAMQAFATKASIAVCRLT